MNSTTTLNFLIELRKRLGWSLVALTILFIGTVFFANALYTWLAFPLLKQLSPQQHLIATDLVSAFFTPFEFAFYVAIALAMPIFLFQAWQFVAPALYPQEKRMTWPLLLVSVVLFYVGIMFAYLVIFPMLFAFLAHAAPQGVLVMPDINLYLTMTLRLFLIFGLMFEIPVIMIFLAKINLVSRQKLIEWRPYIIVAAFIVGMLVAPPDVLSQTMVALPLWWLYEIGIVLLRFAV